MDRDIELSHVNSEVKKKNWRDRNEGKELKKKKNLHLCFRKQRKESID